MNASLKRLNHHFLVVTITILFMCFSSLMNAQTFSWARQYNFQNASFYGTRSGLDATGNFYSAGWDFIVKTSPTGTTPWSFQYSSTIRINSMTTDPSGNVYITGSYSGTCDFNPSPSVFNLTAAGANDIYIAKFDTNGNFLWAISIGGPGTDEALSLAVDNDGNIIITGRYGLYGSFPPSWCDFDPGPGSHILTSAGNYDYFVEKLDPNGNFLWVKSGGNSQPGQGEQVVIDPALNIYVIGSFSGSVSFDGTNSINSSISGASNFMEKLDPNGNFVWVKQLVTNCCFNVTNMKADADGNIYACAYFSGTIDLDPGPAIYNLTGPGTQNGCVAKYTNNGELVWARAFVSSGSDQSDGMTVDSYGNVYVAGLFSGTGNHDFDPGPGTYYLSCGTSPDLYLVKLNASGNFRWAIQAGGGNGSSATGYAPQINSSGQIYTSVNFSGTVDFDPSKAKYNLTSSAGKYAVLKIDQPNGGMMRGEEIIVKEVKLFSVYPNPSSGSIYIDFPELSTGAIVSISDMLGRQVYSRILTETERVVGTTKVEFNKKGNYIISVRDGRNRYVSKLLVQ